MCIIKITPRDTRKAPKKPIIILFKENLSFSKYESKKLKRSILAIYSNTVYSNVIPKLITKLKSKRIVFPKIKFKN
jgi:hypothetical protein